MSPRAHRMMLNALNALFLVVTILWLAFVYAELDFFMRWNNVIYSHRLETLLAEPRRVWVLASTLIPFAAWAVFVRWRSRGDRRRALADPPAQSARDEGA